jgi:hypothetical protein
VLTVKGSVNFPSGHQVSSVTRFLAPDELTLIQIGASKAALRGVAFLLKQLYIKFP